MFSTRGARGTVFSRFRGSCSFTLGCEGTNFEQRLATTFARWKPGQFPIVIQQVNAQISLRLFAFQVELNRLKRGQIPGFEVL